MRAAGHCPTRGGSEFSSGILMGSFLDGVDQHTEVFG
eukprot:COSAG02_NODE_39202_length_420_cov_0.451713_1_plen_36_part_10